MTSRSRVAFPARAAAFRTLRAITGEDAYANLALPSHTAGLSARDAGFATELVSGTCRSLGLYDAILTSAGALKIGGNAIWAEWFNGLID